MPVTKTTVTVPVQSELYKQVSHLADMADIPTEALLADLLRVGIKVWRDMDLLRETVLATL